MIYLDTSCLLKLLRPEASSEAVWNAINEEEAVMVSALAELETLVQLKGFYLGGTLTRNQWRQAEAQFHILRNEPPFEFRRLSADIFPIAFRQHRNSGVVHCHTLDRLHLAAMEELEISRLMTHDSRQARAAFEAGFKVFQPH